MVIGRQLKVPWWNLLIHDLSKFLPSELPHLTRKFFGHINDKKGFQKYYLLHTSRNKHHPRYWVDPVTGPKMVPMYIAKEMLADWASATMVYSGIELDYNNWEWFDKAFPGMNLHPVTRERILFALNELKNLTNGN